MSGPAADNDVRGRPECDCESAADGFLGESGERSLIHRPLLRLGGLLGGFLVAWRGQTPEIGRSADKSFEVPKDKCLSFVAPAQRDGAVQVARVGTRVSLESVVRQFREGASPESILQRFPALDFPANVYGAIAFALESPGLVDEYLARQQKMWESLARNTDAPPQGLSKEAFS